MKGGVLAGGAARRGKRDFAWSRSNGGRVRCGGNEMAMELQRGREGRRSRKVSASALVGGSGKLKFQRIRQPATERERERERESRNGQAGPSHSTIYMGRACVSLAGLSWPFTFLRISHADAWAAGPNFASVFLIKA